MKILAGDIGGTKSDLAIYSADYSANLKSSKPLFSMRFFNRDQVDLITMLQSFMAQSGMQVQVCCLAVAGVIQHGYCKMPNLHWVIDTSEVQKTLGIERVLLVNDLKAAAYGVMHLPEHGVSVVNPGVADSRGNKALIAAGTGLGEAILFQDGQGGYRVSASEGGHADYGPNSDEEIELLRYLKFRFGHVSWERVVSGNGLGHSYDYLSSLDADHKTSDVAHQIVIAEDKASKIARFAASGQSSLCANAVEVFLTSYGAEAGNLALKSLATGGLYIGGGIAPKLASAFTADNFLFGFTNKGRFADLMKNIPVYLITDNATVLKGAVVLALSGN